MNKGIKYLIAALITIYLILVFVLDYGSSTSKENYEIKQEKLEQAKEQLQEEIEQEDRRIEVFLKQEKGIRQAVDSNINEYRLKKEKIHETISDIESSDNLELYRFFANFKTDSAKHSH